MDTKSQQYPALYVIFTLLNAVRRGIPRKNIWREFLRQGIALKPRLVFWLALCRQAGLLKEIDGSIKVTSYAHSWLKKTPEQQTISLIEAWQTAPKNKKAWQFRKKLLWKLRYNKPITTKDHMSLHGLDALGLTAQGALTQWGSFFIQNEGNLPTPKPALPCVIDGDQFIASLDSCPGLLWQLELHLRPSQPGKYPLTKRTLHFHQGDPAALIQLLEDGLKRPLPDRIRTLIRKQPSIQITEGIVLEFSSPAELAQLRRQPVLRKYFEKFISSQAVLIAQKNAKLVFELLKRRGVYVHGNEEQAPTVEVRRTHFPRKTVLKPVGTSQPKLNVLEAYKQLGLALDVLYRAPGCTVEQRRITPLAIEHRGEHTYVIAYCQTRRGQRTFRLDRMEVPGTW